LSANEILKQAIFNKTNNFKNINFVKNFITKLIYVYKNGKKKTLKLYISGSLNLNY